ncbi:MAG: leucyl/phenylalanyl-tRNA--protein transferase [Planctomycetota bacterium]|jgi:leucyl/phenylalanyl-tRNA--protein transferase
MTICDASGCPVDAAMVLDAYRARCFPMADHRHGRLAWYRPATRAVITWDTFRIARSLAKTARRAPYRITVNQACDQVIAACATRDETWISHDIEALYLDLHRAGHVQSVEAWCGEKLVGGLYGLALGGCFCGESMFHRADDAAKLCVISLVERLQLGGFTVLDCQQHSAHMARFGAYEISDAAYAEVLDDCLADSCTFA